MPADKSETWWKWLSRREPPPTNPAPRKEFKSMAWRATFRDLDITGRLDAMTYMSDAEFEKYCIEYLAEVFKPEVKIQYKREPSWQDASL